MSYSKIKSKFFVCLHQSMVTNAHQYVTKMTLNVTVGGLWIDFIAIFWITKYLQRPIYIWNKISKCIMFRCGVYFQFIPSHKTHNLHHFGPIEYVNDLFKSFKFFKTNDHKVHIILNDFSSFSN
jgi:hypothetical protein